MYYFDLLTSDPLPSIKCGSRKNVRRNLLILDPSRRFACSCARPIGNRLNEKLTRWDFFLLSTKKSTEQFPFTPNRLHMYAFRFYRFQGMFAPQTRSLSLNRNISIFRANRFCVILTRGELFACDPCATYTAVGNALSLISVSEIKNRPKQTTINVTLAVLNSCLLRVFTSTAFYRFYPFTAAVDASANRKRSFGRPKTPFSSSSLFPNTQLDGRSFFFHVKFTACSTKIKNDFLGNPNANSDHDEQADDSA